MEGDEYIDSNSETDEGVNSTASSSSTISIYNSQNVNTDDSVPVDFDTALPVGHNYLGEDLEELRGRTLLDDDSTQLLSLLPQPDVVLVPGQTLPLMVFYPPTVNMLRELVHNHGTFGVVCTGHSDVLHRRMANIGTTAEIYEYSDDENRIGFRIKAKGRQRFQIIETERRMDGNVIGKVKILPEVVLPPSLFEQGLRCLDRFRTNPSNRNSASTEHQIRLKRQHQIAQADSVVTPWPRSTGSTMTLPSDPSELSFWAAQTLPLLDEQRLTLLRVNSPIQRLRWELSILEKYNKKYFQKKYDIGNNCIVHSKTGKMNRLLKCLQGKQTDGRYAWTVAECSQCSRHLGWKFTATKRSLKPHKFWGIRRNAIATKLIPEDDVQPVI
ncbi:Protein cereblon [Blattella germanica]|nr:Protein cereblon [Blattella germanica]